MRCAARPLCLAASPQLPLPNMLQYPVISKAPCLTASPHNKPEPAPPPHGPHLERHLVVQAQVVLDGARARGIPARRMSGGASPWMHPILQP